ncbi:MAG: hypothetical protein Kow0090_10490 [Myxococcota bacterium]
MKKKMQIVSLVFSGAILALSALAQSPATPPATGEADAGVEEAAPPEEIAQKPPIRVLHQQSRNFELFLTVQPGIPEVGRVVEFLIKAYKIPKTPHPQYGGRIPMDTAIIVATAAHESEISTSIDYLLHPVGDPGNFGFHFTPIRQGYHNIIFFGEFEGEKFDVKFRVPVDVWPLPASELKSEASSQMVERDIFGLATKQRFVDPSAQKTSPVRKGPVMPGATGKTESGMNINELMRKLGMPWAELGDELFVKPKPSDKKGGSALDELYTVAQMLQNSTPINFVNDAAEYQQYMSELFQSLGRLNSEFRKQKFNEARLLYKIVEKDNCTRCHVKFRWKLVGDLSGYPGNLPGR